MGVNDGSAVGVAVAVLHQYLATVFGSPEDIPRARLFGSNELLVEEGFSNTDLWFSDEPMEETMPSPTRARIVSSPAPPTNWRILARTVTRALAMTGKEAIELVRAK